MSWYREHIEKPIIDVYVKKTRSAEWGKTRKNFLSKNPKCAACGTDKKLQVHHIQDFSTNPSLELDYNNLITLCMHNKCHIVLGHLGHWQSINPSVKQMSSYLRWKIMNRR